MENYISACTFNYHIDSYQPRLLFADDVDYNSQSLSNTWVERSHSLLKTTLEEAAFVSAFYNSIWAGQTLGVAFQTARRLAKTVVPESLDWLAYVLFADPMARPYRPVQGQGYAVVEPIGQEIDDPVSPGSTVRFRVSLRRTPPSSRMVRESINGGG
ncbi:hypothetical protein CDG77_17865 [Nostoc sp. 'Peltigera membranacea cyanobiont' 213]|uniref:hypothetical protein n=1 Tax=Nostoc sp. 'Peltigera membranacea cyanobiont' 213 TaxID=2014530 RepID=UPI000B95C76D|nr:hypothetical protein [Nostoc sp. 'Peltigera membranacea cyanobiont' 213]OYD89880.1 hypothetical protein CDG77_17865 [Nostoc sp. 'Peltigera membranacea cyanobiont' 213]